MNYRPQTGKLIAGVRGVALAVCFGMLSGCVGGTTYGTGVSQEKQTVSDFYNFLSLKTERKNIDYSARPDLIVPENKDVLPEPVDTAAATANPQWPETPEQRVARIQAQAGEVDPRTGDYSIEEQLRKKEGIGIETGSDQNKYIPGVTDKDGARVLYRGESEARKEVVAAKSEFNPSKGASRKFLTEPPVEYRTPAETAPAGDDAYSEEELAAQLEAKRKLEKEEREDPLRKQ